MKTHDLEELQIRNLYTLEETIAADYLSQFVYPWEALAGIENIFWNWEKLFPKINSKK